MAGVIQVLGVGCLCAATSMPQIVGLSYYRRMLANYKDGIEQPIDTNTHTLIQKVLDHLKVDTEGRSYLKFFSSFDNNPVYRGESNLKLGAIIGIPPTFAYQSPSDIDRETLTVGADQKLVDWDSQAGKDLEQSMILSERAKAFAIARQVRYVETWHVYSQMVMRMTFLTLTYSAVYKMQELLQIRQRLRMPARYSVYSLTGAAFFFLYLTISDTYNCWRDNRVDNKVGTMSKDFAEGGLEFYEKTLLRNQAIRKLMGRDGPKFYTMFGNDKATWRMKNTQFTARRDHLKKILSQFPETDTEMDEGSSESV